MVRVLVGVFSSLAVTVLFVSAAFILYRRKKRRCAVTEIIGELPSSHEKVRSQELAAWPQVFEIAERRSAVELEEQIRRELDAHESTGELKGSLGAWELDGRG